MTHKSTERARHWWLMPVTPGTWKSEIRAMLFKASPDKYLISKIARATWTGGVTQIVEHLFCKYRL
jgi:hypothetical protein